IERKWGDRRSAPRDYIFERPVFLGKMRMGQDIANIGARAPKEQESPPPGVAGAPAASSSPATSPATAPAASPASPAPKAPTSPAPAAPSPAAATAANASPAASPSPAAGAPWPVQTAGEPPMYSAAWHHVHLYSPRSINDDSNMPSYRFLYEKRRISDAR